MKSFDSRLYQINAKHTELAGAWAIQAATRPAGDASCSCDRHSSGGRRVHRVGVRNGDSAQVILVFAAGFGKRQANQSMSLCRRGCLQDRSRTPTCGWLGRTLIRACQLRGRRGAHLLCNAGSATACSSRCDRDRPASPLARLLACSGGRARAPPSATCVYSRQFCDVDVADQVASSRARPNVPSDRLLFEGAG